MTNKKKNKQTQEKEDKGDDVYCVYTGVPLYRKHGWDILEVYEPYGFNALHRPFALSLLEKHFFDSLISHITATFVEEGMSLDKAIKKTQKDYDKLQESRRKERLNDEIKFITQRFKRDIKDVKAVYKSYD